MRLAASWTRDRRAAGSVANSASRGGSACAVFPHVGSRRGGLGSTALSPLERGHQDGRTRVRRGGLSRRGAPCLPLPPVVARRRRGWNAVLLGTRAQQPPPIGWRCSHVSPTNEPLLGTFWTQPL